MNDKNPPVEDYQEEVESNVEWEYYDDTTTLTDLWQKLKGLNQVNLFAIFLRQYIFSYKTET